MISPTNDTIVEIKNLKMYFPVTRGVLRRKIADIKAVDGISFDIKKGETVGLVGESGSGKTTVGRCIVRLYKPTEGQIIFEGQDISNFQEKQLKPLHRKMSFIFQDPYSSLNPRQRAGDIVGAPLLIHKIVSNKAEYRNNVEHLFRTVGLDPSMMGRFPHEFSGGQRQRIGIARALACNPSFIVCDEPVSALDVSIQAQIINLLEDLKEGLKGLTYLFISHDLSVVRHISDRVAVMYLGHIIEIAGCEELYGNPLHPYSKALLSAVPVPDPLVEKKRKRILLAGEIPSPIHPPQGCPFHPRCNIATPECQQEIPLLHDFGNSHKVACLKV